ncbi:hypothetical protein AB0O32_32235 [Streptomyces rubiginosohelvolus]|uniref:hypothetical protein n=1 Tax=Streptomyces rubiginosohelvolus TaxID=67362 RepID=UPI0034485005
MHHLDSARRSVVTAEAMVLPQDAYDSEYYEKRISDDWLLGKSVVMRTARAPCPRSSRRGTGRVGGRCHKSPSSAVPEQCFPTAP